MRWTWPSLPFTASAMLTVIPFLIFFHFLIGAFKNIFLFILLFNFPCVEWSFKRIWCFQITLSVQQQADTLYENFLTLNTQSKFWILAKKKKYMHVCLCIIYTCAFIYHLYIYIHLLRKNENRVRCSAQLSLLFLFLQDLPMRRKHLLERGSRVKQINLRFLGSFLYVLNSSMMLTKK